MPLRAPSADAERARLHEAAQALESLVLKQIVTASKAFTGGEGPGSAVRAGLFADALADAMVKGGGIGLAAQIERSLAPAAGAVAPLPSTASAEPSQSRLTPAWSLQARPGSTLSPHRGEGDHMATSPSPWPSPSPSTCLRVRQLVSCRTLATSPLSGASAGQGSTSTSLPSTSLADALFAASPTPARVTSAFGPRADPFTHRDGLHGGVDLAEREGEPVHVVLGGVVRAAGERGGYGNAVEIDHGGGVTTLYAHASELLVRVGDRVTPGQPIARVGHTGRATGDHLHFEVRVSGRQVDPIRALKIYARRADEPSESGS